MRNISQIDSNFAVDTSLNIEHIRFYNVLQKPFSVHGVFFENGVFRRMPEAVAATVSKKVSRLHMQKV